jgi:hypothetical protein
MMRLDPGIAWLAARDRGIDYRTKAVGVDAQPGVLPLPLASETTRRRWPARRVT